MKDTVNVLKVHWCQDMFDVVAWDVGWRCQETCSIQQLYEWRLLQSTVAVSSFVMESLAVAAGVVIVIGCDGDFVWVQLHPNNNQQLVCSLQRRIVVSVVHGRRRPIGGCTFTTSLQQYAMLTPVFIISYLDCFRSSLF
jgi:hypothetical protein